MIMVSMLSLILAVMILSNVFLSLNLAKQGKKKLMYAMITMSLIITIYIIIRIIEIYNIFKSVND